MTKYLKYTTQQGDRWDLLAQRFYGSPFVYRRIIEANKSVPLRPVLPPNLTLAIPIIQTTEAATLSGLPPWKS